MIPTSLPPCPHRGLEVAPDRWLCSSPQLIVPTGVVPSETCRDHCPFVPRGGAAAKPADREDPIRAPARGRARLRLKQRRKPVATLNGMVRTPLVSCIMPTADRQEFAELAIRCF